MSLLILSLFCLLKSIYGPTSVNIGAEMTLGGTLSCPGWETHTCCPGQDTLISRTRAASPLTGSAPFKGLQTLPRVPRKQ